MNKEFKRRLEVFDGSKKLMSELLPISKCIDFAEQAEKDGYAVKILNK